MIRESLKVLLIEDNPGDVFLFRSYLQNSSSSQLEIEVCQNLTDALHRLKQRKDDFDIILTDLALPDSQGFETFARIYQQAPRIPIVVLSGLDDESIAIQAVREGAQDFLVKSKVTADLLLRSLHYSVERMKTKETLSQARDDLEARVRERTSELAATNEALRKMVSEANRRHREATLITDMVEALQSCLSVEEAYPIIAKCAQQIFAFRSGALFIQGPTSSMLEAVTLWGEALVGEQVCTPDDCWAIRRGRVYLSGNSVQKQPCRHLPNKEAGCYLCIPLAVQGETLGMLHIQTAGEVDAVVIDWAKTVAVTIGNNISLALANIRLRETLRHQVMHDPLTGLFNRRYLDETLTREIARVRRKQAPLGIIMMDLDRFKRFNDTYGHEAGDRLLETLGEFLETQVRKEDVACRYGGEEFVLIMPGASIEVTQKRAEEIRQAVSQLQVFHQGQILEGTTISLGVAIFPKHGSTGEDVLRAADDAMYQAKAAGRNRVMVARTPVNPE